MAKRIAVVPQDTLEATIKALRPFMASYAITSHKQVKLQALATADAGQLEKALNNSGGRAERGAGNTVFVRFEDMTNEEARKITSLAFGEPQDEDDEDEEISIADSSAPYPAAIADDEAPDPFGGFQSASDVNQG